MARMKHGTEGGYRLCHCVKCKAAHAAHAREVRARNAQARTRRSKSKSRVVALSTVPQSVSAAPEPGENELAVRQQIEDSPRAAEKPGTCSQAITLSKILDNPTYAPMWATTSRQLHALLLSLDGPRRKSTGKLFVVQQMVRRAAQ
jgi:hypothetical protein